MFNLTVGHGSLLKFIPEIDFLPEQTKEIKMIRWNIEYNKNKIIELITEVDNQLYASLQQLKVADGKNKLGIHVGKNGYDSPQEAHNEN